MTPEFESVDVDFVLNALEDTDRDRFLEAEIYDEDGPKGYGNAPDEGPPVTPDDVTTMADTIADHEERISLLEDPGI